VAKGYDSTECGWLLANGDIDKRCSGDIEPNDERLCEECGHEWSEDDETPEQPEEAFVYGPLSEGRL
jgi:hypothetical protein